MASALPARKVAGNKTGPVRRQRPAPQKQPKSVREDYSDALRARCHKDALIRKPADIVKCPHCDESHTVITRVGYTKKYAAKWFRTCTNTVTNDQGKRVKCTYFAVPKQPPVPPSQLAGIEAQRLADNTARAAAKAQREAEKATRDAEAHTDNPELQLRAVEATEAAAKAAEEAEKAAEALREGDRQGWVQPRNKTPPPQPSSSRVTLELATQGSASSSRTSTSQAQLDHDREVALLVQKTWDAETNTSPESIRSAKTTDSQERSQNTAMSQANPGERGSDPSNRMRHAARLQQQAAEWLVERTMPGSEGTKLARSSSSSPIVTPTPAARVRNLRPFPIDMISDGNVKMNNPKTPPARCTETPPPSTQPRRAADAGEKRARASSIAAGSPPPSTQPRRNMKSPQKRARSPSHDSVISISSDDTSPPPKRLRAEVRARVKLEPQEAVIDGAGKSDRGNQLERRESAQASLPKRRPLPKPVRAPKPSTSTTGPQPAAEPKNTLVETYMQTVAEEEDALPVRTPLTRESTLESSNKENHDVRPSVHGPRMAFPPSDPPSLSNQDSDNAVAPAALEPSPDVHRCMSTTGRIQSNRTTARVVYDSPCSSAVRRAPRSLPQSPPRPSHGVLVEQKDTGKAPWESSEDDEPAHAHTASDNGAQDGHSSDRDGDVEDVSDEEANEEPGEHTDSSAEDEYLDYLADEAPSRIVEASVDAAVKKPWTHDLDDVEAWYCTVFIWIVSEARPREVLLSMKVGETEVQLSDRPTIYTALGGIRVRTWLVWNFASSTWIEQDFTAPVSVSEFDQHTILIKLPDVRRCVEFGRAMSYAQEPLWPACNEPQDGGDEDHNHESARVADNGQVATAVLVSKPSRKGKEVIRN